MLPGTWDDDVVVLAGSPHAHVRACWIPARPCPCPLDPHMHTLTGYACTHALGPRMHTGPTYACTRPMHACSHWVPTPARSQGPAHSHWVPTPACSWGPSRTLAPGPHARLVSVHARTGSPCPLACGVPMQARTGPCMHARIGPCMHTCIGPYTHAPGPCAHACSGSPCPLAHGVPMNVCTRPMHSCLHQAYARALALGPHACLLVGSPCTCARSLHLCMLHPMLYVVVVICSSTTVCILV